MVSLSIRISQSFLRIALWLVVFLISREAVGIKLARILMIELFFQRLPHLLRMFKKRPLSILTLLVKLFVY